MKKLIFLAIVMSLVSSVCFAQDVPVAAKQPTQPQAPQVQAKTIIGKIQAVSLADAVKGTKNELVVADESGNKITLLVTSTTRIHDSTMAAIGLTQLAKDEKVQVGYHVTAAGANEAASIMLVK